MKKQSISILLLVPMLLTSCGSNNTDPVSLPNKGTEITAEEGKSKFKQSYDAVATSDDAKSTSDAIEFSLSDGSFGFDVDLSTKGSDGKETTPKIKGGFHFADFDASVAIKGITSKSADDVKGYMSLSFSLDYDLTFDGLTLGLGGTTSFKKEKTTYKVEAFFNKDGFYANFSDANVLSLVKGFVGTNYSEILGNGKYYLPATITDSSLPIVEATTEDDSAYNTLEPVVFNMSTEGTFKSHGNDTYSYSYSIDSTKIKEELDEAKKALSDGVNGDLTLNTYVSLLNYLTVDTSSSLDYAVIFNTTKGISSVGFKDTIKLNYKDLTGMSGTVSASASLKASVNVGTSVTVKEVTNKDTYTNIGTFDNNYDTDGDITID